MPVISDTQDRDRPENLVPRLAARLRNHVLWDSLLLFIPPVLAGLYTSVFTYLSEWIGPVTLVLTIFGVCGLGLLGVMLRTRPRIPSIPRAAGLADERARSQDRFLTLATVKPSVAAAPFLARLSQETAGFADRVEPRRDFPYRFKKSFYRSMALSLVAALLLHFLVPVARSVIRPTTVPQKIRELAEKMAQRENLTQVAKELEALAAKLEDPRVPQGEKREAAEEMEKKIEEQQKKEEQKDNSDLLSQAANTLKGLEEQPSPSGQEQKKDQDKGSGGIQNNLPQDGKSEGDRSQGGGAESKGEMSAQMSTDLQQGKSAQGDPKEPGKDKNQQDQGGTKNDQRDPNQPGKEQNNEKVGKSQGGSKEGAGKNQASDEPPLGAPPAERFYKAGEGKEGIKGARYVTVQLPEEVAADSKGESKSTKEGSGNRARPNVPVSNVPLPAHIPNAPAEKQQIPIEYRGIIR